VKRPLLFHLEAAEADAAFWLDMQLAYLNAQDASHDNSDGLDIPEFLRRAA
jgi:hypothetical protein